MLNIKTSLPRRYEWELRQGNAPILRRVLEQDESPGRLMVLCVAGIKVKSGALCLSILSAVAYKSQSFP